jgi:hypothetical protein
MEYFPMNATKGYHYQVLTAAIFAASLADCRCPETDLHLADAGSLPKGYSETVETP